MKSNKGSHVGMVLSFVIFVTFLFFLYTSIEPAVKQSENQKALLNNLKGELEIKFSEVLITAIVVNNTNPDERECLLVNHSNFINSSLINITSLSAIVKDINGTLLESEFTESKDSLYIGWKENESFFKIYYSEEPFSEYNFNGNHCENFYETDYYLGLVTAKKYFFETKIVKTFQEYATDYELLKEELRIPIYNDFSFGFIYSNGTEISTEEKNITKNVYAGEFPLQYLDSEANIEFGTLKIKIW